jgi:hypothetical protein
MNDENYSEEGLSGTVGVTVPELVWRDYEKQRKSQDRIFHGRYLNREAAKYKSEGLQLEQGCSTQQQGRSHF